MTGARASLILLTAAGALLASTELQGQDRFDLEVPDNPLEGRLLFENRGCHHCHGIDRSGPGPALTQGNFGGTFLELGAALWNHVPAMSVEHETSDLPWPTLDAEETVQLLSFLHAIEYLGRPGVAARGREIFTTKGCGVCHSIGGIGASEMGPDLAELTRFVSPLYLAQAIWNHGPSMLESMQERKMTPPSFEEGDLADLSAFLRQEGGGGPKERMLLAPGNPNRGRKIFVSKGCSKCHRDRGDGVYGAPNLVESPLHRSAEGIAGTMWNHALSMHELMREHGMEWPAFTTTEMADLIAYLYFLPFEDRPGDAARGAASFENRSCAACHAPDADSEHAGPDLTQGAVASSAALVAAMWNHAPIMKEVILGEGRPWPTLAGSDLRDLLAYLDRE